jgi:hypothetical protein
VPTPHSTRTLISCFLLAAFNCEAQIVINEVHYDPSDNTKQEEFIELHNPTAASVNIGGWRLEDGVAFTVPAGTSIPAGGYLVVAGNTAHFQTRYGFLPLGPWAGILSNSGERITLKNAAGLVVDEVDYAAGFPWPTSPRGLGNTMELLHPSLDNELGGSWRASLITPDSPFIARGSSGWRVRETRSEPPASWKQLGFDDTGAEWANCTMPAGFALGAQFTPTVAWGTTLGFGGNTSDKTRAYYFRKKFNVPNPAAVSALTFRIRRDDGAILWLNNDSTPTVMAVDTGGAWNPPGAPYTFNSLAPNATGNTPGLADYATFSIPAAKLVAGENIVAIQLHQSSAGSSDLLIDAELVVPGVTGGTPGAQNTVFATLAPPQIRQVAHTPEQPAANVPVLVTARISDPQGVSSATLSYQLVDPGSYIRKTDAAYSTSWTNLAMNDAGTGGDLLAGDGIFSATLSAGLQTHRRLVRYRISATDGASSVTAPYADDEQPNFAYFVYNGFPSWAGRNQPPSGAATTFPSSLFSTLPAYHLIANETDVVNSQYNNAFDTIRMWGTMVYDGKVYDHILYHNKGSASTYQSGKNKWRFHFNRARNFEARDSWGRKYGQTWDTFTMHACASPWNPVFRGWAGLDEVVSARIFELAGVPVSKMHHTGFRVIRRAVESPTPGSNVADPFAPSGSFDGQYSSDVLGLYLVIEDPDGSFLDERGLEDGSVYHIAGNAGDKTYQGAQHPSDTSDWNAFSAGSQSNTANTAGNEAWWRANMDVAAYASFHAGNRITGNVDLREGWNHYFYRRGGDGRWVPIPWDLDMMYFPETHWSGTIDQKNALFMTGISIEFKNRARELLDLICGDGSATGGQIGQLVDEYRRIIRPAGHAVGWDLLDQYMWNHHPRTTGGHTGAFYLPNPTTDGRIGGNWTRTYSSSDFLGATDFLVKYATDTDPDSFAVGDGDQRGYGYNYLELEATDAAIPNRPTISYSGPVGYPANGLSFTTSAFSDPQGAGTFAAVQWRVGEIAAPGVGAYVAGQPFKYEVEDVYRSPEITSSAPTFVFPVTACEPGRLYRARARFKDNTGRWSRWSPAVEFTAATPDVSVFTSSLVVSELNYNPAPVSPAEFSAGFSSDDFEWVEIKNIGAAPVDLTGVRFTKGIDFDFPAGWTIPQNGYALVVRNLAAFQSRWGTALNGIIAGTTADNFSNGGDEVKLSYGAGTEIFRFLYDDIAPWPVGPDGTGRTLVMRSPAPLALANQTNGNLWRESYSLGGSPGADDVLTFDAWNDAYPAATNPAGDEDFDGLANLIEYALASSPLAVNAGPVSGTAGFTVLGIPGTYLTFTVTRRTNGSDIAADVQFAESLAGPWAASGVLASSVANPDGTVTEVWRSPFSLDAKPVQFARFRVQKP